MRSHRAISSKRKIASRTETRGYDFYLTYALMFVMKVLIYANNLYSATKFRISSLTNSNWFISVMSSIILPYFIKRQLPVNQLTSHKPVVLFFKKSNWWLAYDVIKNMTMQIMINLPQILLWPIRPYNVSLYQLWTYLDQRKQSYGPKKLENFLLCYMGRWAGKQSFAYQHWLLQYKRMEIF